MEFRSSTAKYFLMDYNDLSCENSFNFVKIPFVKKQFSSYKLFTFSNF